MMMYSSTTSKQVPDILITPDSLQIEKIGTVNQSTLSGATNTLVLLMSYGKVLSMVRMVLLVLLS